VRASNPVTVADASQPVAPIVIASPGTSARWAARLSPAARLPKPNPTKQQLAWLKGYQRELKKFPEASVRVSHAAGADFKPAASTRSVFFSALAGAASC